MGSGPDRQVRQYVACELNFALGPHAPAGDRTDADGPVTRQCRGRGGPGPPPPEPPESRGQLARGMGRSAREWS